MGDINSFNIGDTVAFKLNADDLTDDKKFIVVGKKGDRILISKCGGEIKEVYPAELLTSQEVEKNNKDGWEQWKNI